MRKAILVILLCAGVCLAQQDQIRVKRLIATESIILDGSAVPSEGDLGLAGGAGLIGYKVAETGSVLTTVDAKLNQFLSLTDFGADATGVTSSVVALTAACTAAGVTKPVVVPPGDFKVDADYTCNAVLLVFGRFVISSGKILTAPNFIAGDNTQHISGSGAFTGPTEVRAEWWYSGSGTWHNAINSAIACVNPLETSPAVAPLPNPWEFQIPSGGIVWIPGGSIVTTGTIQMRSHVTLQGFGMQSSIIYYSGSGKAFNLGSNTTNSVYTVGIVLKDFGLRGTAAATDGIFSYAVSRLLLKNLNVYGFSNTNALSYTGTHSSESPQTVVQTGASGIHLFDVNTFVKIDHCFLSQNYNGIKATNLAFTVGGGNNAIEITGAGEINHCVYGILFGNAGVAPGSTNIQVSIHDITVEACDTTGIWLIGGRAFNVSHNYLEGNGAYGIRLGDTVNTDPCAAFTINNNYLQTAGIATIALTRAYNSTFVGNNLEGSGTAFYLTAASFYNRIMDNRINGGAGNVNDSTDGSNVVSSLEDAIIAASLSSPWANIGGEYAVAGYSKDDNNIVHLDGYVEGGSVPSTILTLPVLFRPYLSRLFTTTDITGGINSIKVDTSGVVSVLSSTNAKVSLSGISFKAQR